MKTKTIMKALAVFVALTAIAYAANIPAGTAVNVRLNSEISSGTAQVGQTFSGTLMNDLAAGGHRSRNRVRQ